MSRTRFGLITAVVTLALVAIVAGPASAQLDTGSIVGTVTDAFYVKPHIGYNLTENLGVRADVIYSHAIFASAGTSATTVGASHQPGRSSRSPPVTTGAPSRAARIRSRLSSLITGPVS